MQTTSKGFWIGLSIAIISFAIEGGLAVLIAVNYITKDNVFILLVMLGVIFFTGIVILIWSLVLVKPIKVINHQVHLDNFINKKRTRIALYLTLISNIPVSLDKVVKLTIPWHIRGKVQSLVEFPIYFKLNRDDNSEYIFLEPGKTVKLNDSREIVLDAEADAAQLKVLNELVHNINWKLNYSITYWAHDKKKYTFQPSKKEKRQQERSWQSLLDDKL